MIWKMLVFHHFLPLSGLSHGNRAHGFGDDCPEPCPPESLALLLYCVSVALGATHLSVRFARFAFASRQLCFCFVFRDMVSL